MSTAVLSIAALEVRTMRISRARSPLAPGLPYGITETERSLLEVLSNGQTYDQIAAEFSINKGTIVKRSHRIMQKFGVHTAAAAVAIALRKGIIK